MTRDKSNPEPEWVLRGEVTTYVPHFYECFPTLQQLVVRRKVRQREHNRTDVRHGRSKYEFNLADIRREVAARQERMRQLR